MKGSPYKETIIFVLSDAHPFYGSHEARVAPTGRHAALWAATERSESSWNIL
jgi:hypothetical protein